MRLIQVRWAATMVMNIADVHFCLNHDRPVHFERRKQPATSARAHCPLWLSIVRICKVCQQITLHQLADTILQSVSSNHTPPTCGHNCNNLRETDPCDHSATHVADQVRPMCDPCATTMRHPNGAIFNFLSTGPCEIPLH